MALFFFLVMFAAYVAAGSYGYRYFYSHVDPTTMAITVGISDLLGLLNGAMNGIYPRIPLDKYSLFPFMVVIFASLIVTNSIGLRYTVGRKDDSIITYGIFAFLVNLARVLILGVPLFYATLATSNLLFKAS